MKKTQKQVLSLIGIVSGAFFAVFLYAEILKFMNIQMSPILASFLTFFLLFLTLIANVSLIWIAKRYKDRVKSTSLDK